MRVFIDAFEKKEISFIKKKRENIYFEKESFKEDASKRNI